MSCMTILSEYNSVNELLGNSERIHQSVVRLLARHIRDAQQTIIGDKLLLLGRRCVFYISLREE